ncbi:hypothetical protein BDV27DRAFT_76215 [Aspergillus caelatus]|uniref:Uncharacterized protein n=1 Tax=Aspergillus caelatus TaxID=61420 RepID=A0A5N7AF64_9EURO|nr:uncharacterized protein BDV27DRAFT_76215 [Aspergillus caelatus]KAE8367290.1 hypothetical protein BDV27DRAFT_76215 [Aspergillus caelatus]
MGKSVTTLVWVLIYLFITEDMLVFTFYFFSLLFAQLGVRIWGLWDMVLFFLRLISSPHRRCASFLSDFIHRLLGRSGDMIQDSILHSCLDYTTPIR